MKPKIILLVISILFTTSFISYAQQKDELNKVLNRIDKKVITGLNNKGDVTVLKYFVNNNTGKTTRTLGAVNQKEMDEMFISSLKTSTKNDLRLDPVVVVKEINNTPKSEESLKFKKFINKTKLTGKEIIK